MIARWPPSAVAITRSPRAHLPFGERCVDPPLRRLRHTDDERPIEFLQLPTAKEGGELSRRCRVAGEQENAAGVAVEPVDETGRLRRVEAERVEHRVEVTGDAAAALHRQAGRLVERDHVAVAVDDRRLHHVDIRLVHRRQGAAGRALLAEIGKWRHADPVAWRQSGAGAGALAVHADLAGAQQFLQAPVPDGWVVPLEPAVEPLGAVLGCDLQGGDAAHVRAPRVPA